MKIIPSLTDLELKRFWEKVDTKGEDDCWNWTASTTGSKVKYGQVGFRRNGIQTLYLSHRVALSLTSDHQGLVARHSCDNPLCCNPKHLEWGTTMDNVQDRVKRNRSAYNKGEKCGRSKLKESDVLQIRMLYDCGVGPLDIAKRFNIGKTNVHRIVNREIWSHI